MNTGDRATDPRPQARELIPHRLDEPAHQWFERIDLPAFADRSRVRLS
jgi:hypothetical protein